SAVSLRLELEVAVDRVRYLDRPAVDAERIDHELGVLQALGAAGFVRHPNSEDVLGAQSSRAEESRQRGIDSAGNADHSPRKSAPPYDLVLQKRGKPVGQEPRVDLEVNVAVRTERLRRDDTKEPIFDLSTSLRASFRFSIFVRGAHAYII